jgi:Spy/CpxP family protein refolding chaperone
MISETIRGEDGLEPRSRWWQTADVQRELRLTPTQVRKLDALFEQGLPERRALHRKIEEMDRLLERIVERGNADDGSVARLSQQVEALRSQANIRRTLMLYAMYRTLTHDQRAALTQIRRAHASSGTRPIRSPTED